MRIPESMKRFTIGDRVKVKDIKAGMGTIIGFLPKLGQICVEFDTPNGQLPFHNGNKFPRDDNGRMIIGKSGHCWNCPTNNIIVISKVDKHPEERQIEIHELGLGYKEE